MRPRDRGKPEKRLVPRPEALPKPQISRPVRGVRPEIRRSNATYTADAINNNLQLLVNCLNLAESVRISVPCRQERIPPDGSNDWYETILGITNASITILCRSSF